jgi:hypothetical protein
MRPGALKRALVVVGCGVLTVTFSACESTQQESAKIGREAEKLGAGPAALKLGAVNHSVRVASATLLNANGRMAVAVKLTATSKNLQKDVPVLVNVTGAGGKVLYTNESGGVEASLQRMALLHPGDGEWWVDDQVLTSQSTSGVKVRVGTGSTVRSNGSVPVLAAKAGHVSQQAGISVLSGELVNHSNKAQSKVPVFAAAVREGKVVAAGRAVVSELPGRSGAPAPFQIFLIGNPAGAKIELTAVPTAV